MPEYPKPKKHTWIGGLIIFLIKKLVEWRRKQKEKPRPDEPHEPDIPIPPPPIDWGCVAGIEVFGAVAKPTFEWPLVLFLMHQRVLNVLRVFCFLQRSDESNPPEERTEMPFEPRPGDGGGMWKCDLTKINIPFVYGRLKDLCEEARKKGIIVLVCLFDECCMRNADAWSCNCWNGNNNDGQTPRGLTHGVPAFYTDRRFRKHQEHLIGNVVNSLKGFENVVFEVMNEPSSQYRSRAISWQSWAVSLIRAYARPNRVKVAAQWGLQCGADYQTHHCHTNDHPDAVLPSSIVSTDGWRVSGHGSQRLEERTLRAGNWFTQWLWKLNQEGQSVEDSVNPDWDWISNIKKGICGERR